jgi:hypothetical protein
MSRFDLPCSANADAREGCMTVASAHSIERSVHKTNEWLKDLAADLSVSMTATMRGGSCAATCTCFVIA